MFLHSVVNKTAFEQAGISDKAVENLTNVLVKCGVLAKCRNFTASAQDLASWFGLFNDLSQCRQRGLSYGGKMLFVTEFNESLIVARRDQNG
jgi:hypothetical protein